MTHHNDASALSCLADHMAFTGNPLDRADALRADTDLFKRHMSRPDTRFLCLEKGTIGLLPTDHRPPSVLGWLSIAKLTSYFPSAVQSLDAREAVFLGLSNKGPRWAITVSAPSTPQVTEADHPLKFTDLRTAAFKKLLPGPDLAICAQAKSMLDWHIRHRFCAVCGAQSKLTKAGYERACTACNAKHYPRTDPVVIMLATYKDQALVGRHAGLPPGIYSALAGFMEPGETIEEAVRRELMEEAAVEAGRVDYICSQPWPWPSSLMIACMADALTHKITLDPTELEDARWISRDEARQALASKHPSLLLPPPLAVAHKLLTLWAEQ